MYRSLGRWAGAGHHEPLGIAEGFGLSPEADRGGGGTESFKPRPDVLKPEVLMSLSHSSVQGRWLGSVGRWQQARQEWSGSRGAFGRDREEGTIP